MNQTLPRYPYSCRRACTCHMSLQFSVVSRGALLCVCHSLVVIVPYVRLCTPTTTKSSVWYGIVPLDPGLASSSFYVPR